MAGLNAQQEKLRRFIVEEKMDEAESLVLQDGEQSEAVLELLEAGDDAEVRRTVVELAGLKPTAGHCRLLLRRMFDADMEIRELAAYLLPSCPHNELAPDYRAAMQKKPPPPPDTLGVLALMLGRTGDSGDIAFLRKLREKNDDDGVDHDIGLALIRLGDTEERRAFEERLLAGDPARRVEALNECLYIDDVNLVFSFGALLSDMRDVVALSIPENPPMEYARVADVAVQTMLSLGVKLSFELEMLQRFDDEKLREAREYVVKKE